MLYYISKKTVIIQKVLKMKSEMELALYLTEKMVKN